MEYVWMAEPSYRCRKVGAKYYALGKTKDEARNIIAKRFLSEYKKRTGLNAEYSNVLWKRTDCSDFELAMEDVYIREIKIGEEFKL